MAIVSDQNCLDFMGIESKGKFTITAANDKLILTSDQGGPVTIDIPDDTYEGADLATALATAMNANTTLTGGAITFAVTYSSSTYFFTIDATVGYTIALTYSGSDAALTLGYSDDFATAQTITSDTTVPIDPSGIVTTIHAGVEEKVINHCDRSSFNSATYTHEMHNGNGFDKLWLRNYPVTAIASASTCRIEAINIKNTDTAASNASVTVSVADATMTLTLAGGANPGDNEVAFATYTTLEAIVTQINTLGEGWSAEIVNTDYNDLLSTELLQLDGKYVGSRRGQTASWSGIEIAGDPIGDFRMIGETGELYRSGGWAAGYQNIAFTYTAGYSSATMPDDLKMAVLRWVKIIYDRVEESGDGLASLGEGQLATKYLVDIPDVVMTVIDHPKYRRRIIV